MILVLKGLSLEVKKNNIVALLGSNGAGKTTTLKAISGLLRPDNGDITDGDIVFEGEKIHKKDAAEIVKMLIFQVMEGRRVFKDLTVEENLIVGAYTSSSANIKSSIEKVYSYFPDLRREEGSFLVI